MFKERISEWKDAPFKYFPGDPGPRVCDFQNTLGDTVPHLGTFLAKCHLLSVLENGACLRATESK